MRVEVVVLREHHLSWRRRRRRVRIGIRVGETRWRRCGRSDDGRERRRWHRRRIRNRRSNLIALAGDRRSKVRRLTLSVSFSEGGGETSARDDEERREPEDEDDDEGGDEGEGLTNRAEDTCDVIRCNGGVGETTLFFFNDGGRRSEEVWRTRT